MGIWPFFRRKTRKGILGTHNVPPRNPVNGSDMEDIVAGPGMPERRKSRRDTKRKSSRDSKKLQKTFSFSPGRHDSIHGARTEDHPPVPPLPSNWRVNGRSNSQEPISNTAPRPLRSSTQPAAEAYEWQRMPTLSKRTGQELGRRKSSKRQRRQEDETREAEIKAMVAFLPKQAPSKATGKLQKAQSSKKKETTSPQQPSSDVSLPLPESLRSSRSESSGNETSFRLSALDALAPRPTIRYSEQPKYAPGASGFISERSESRMRRISQRASVPEGALKTSKRIDDLADDLSARELRELMERDSKRRDKKRIADRIKAEQRIARQQEKQKSNEATAIRGGTPPPANMERGVMGRDVIGLGIGTSTIVTSSKRKGSTGSNSGRGKRPSDRFQQETLTASPIDGRNPFHSSTENMTPVSDRSEPVLEIAQLGTIRKANVSPPIRARGHNRGASSISQMIDLSKQEDSTPAPAATPELSQLQAPRRLSQTSSRAPQTWTSFFKLRQRTKTGHATVPTSFSNKSRDSTSTTHATPATQIGYQPMRSTSNIPKRTMSKFREDLPELPISPPPSRVQSPEADVVPPIRSDYLEKRAVNILSEDHRVRYDTPNSGYRSIEAARLRNETPTSGHRSVAPSPEPTAIMSQSMASIDSEASWLSGRGGSKRTMSQAPEHNFHDSSTSLSKKYKELSESSEELGIAEDEYFSRLSPGPEEEFKINRFAGNPMPSSDEEDGGSFASPVLSEKSQWKSAARHPTIVHRPIRAKSREVLLTDFGDETPGDENRNSFEMGDDSSLGLQRATSVNLGMHHRNMSAGSARLLDLKPRGSGDAKRSSMGAAQN